LAAGRNDGVARGESRFHDIDAHAAAGTRDEPGGLIGHGISGRQSFAAEA